MYIPDNYLNDILRRVSGAAAFVVGLSITKVKAQLRKIRELLSMLGIAASLSFLLMMLCANSGGTTARMSVAYYFQS